MPDERAPSISPLEALHGQWIIGQGIPKPSESFREIELRSASLYIHPSLRALPVIASGTQVGWLLGSPIDLGKGEFLQTDYTIDTEPTDPDRWVEESIYTLAGSFLFLLDSGGHCRLYLDCAGSLSAVYDPERRRVGATAEIVFEEDEYRERLLNKRRRDLEVAADGWISGDLTAHRGLSRLLANHYLDLDTFETARHWPRGPLIQDLSADEAAERISNAAIPTIRAAANSGPSFMALTGGYDTRVLLSLARELRQDIEFLTISAPGAERDIFLAKKLALRFGLKHRILPFVQATEGQRQAWDVRVGHVVTGANRRMHPSLWPLGNAVLVGGVGGEVGRGFLWMGATEASSISATAIIDRLKLAREPDLVKFVETWLSSMPKDLNALEVLDLAFIELRNSSWAFGQAYSNPLTIKINPLNSRSAYAAMLGSSPEARRGNALFRTVIEKNWPELLTIPVNRYGNYRDRLERVMLGLRRPDKALRKARQLIRARSAAGRPPVS
jgi:hypothetical protein